MLVAGSAVVRRGSVENRGRLRRRRRRRTAADGGGGGDGGDGGDGGGDSSDTATLRLRNAVAGRDYARLTTATDGQPRRRVCARAVRPQRDIRAGGGERITCCYARSVRRTEKKRKRKNRNEKNLAPTGWAISIIANDVRARAMNTIIVSIEFPVYHFRQFFLYTIRLF